MRFAILLFAIFVALGICLLMYDVRGHALLVTTNVSSDSDNVHQVKETWGLPWGLPYQEARTQLTSLDDLREVDNIRWHAFKNKHKTCISIGQDIRSYWIRPRPLAEVELLLKEGKRLLKEDPVQTDELTRVFKLARLGTHDDRMTRLIEQFVDDHVETLMDEGADAAKNRELRNAMREGIRALGYIGTPAACSLLEEYAQIGFWGDTSTLTGTLPCYTLIAVAVESMEDLPFSLGIPALENAHDNIFPSLSELDWKVSRNFDLLYVLLNAVDIQYRRKNGDPRALAPYGLPCDEWPKATWRYTLGGVKVEREPLAETMPYFAY